MSLFAACMDIAVSAVWAVPGKEETKAARAKHFGDASQRQVFGDTLFVAPTIIIEAARPHVQDDLVNRSGFVAMVDLDGRRERVETLSDVLTRMVGVRVKQYGGLGSFATVSIRGSSSNQVQVYLDGIPMNDAYSGTVNLADLPIGGVSRIEVFRGFTPSHLGASAIGGVVNLVTHDPAKWKGDRNTSRFEVDQSYGSFDTWKHRLSMWPHFGPFRLFLNGGYTSSEGNFTYTHDAGTPMNPNDDVTTTRLNNDFEMWNLLGRLHGDIPYLGTLSLGYDLVDRNQGVPGRGSYPSLTARSKRRRHLTSLHLEPRPLLSDRFIPTLTGFYSHINERFSDRDGDIGLLKQDTDNTISLYGAMGRARLHPPLLPLSFDVFFEGKHERFHPENALPFPSSGPDRLRRAGTFSVTANVSLFDNALVLSASERYEHHTNEFYDPPLFPWLPPSPQGKITHEKRVPQYGFRWSPMNCLTVKGNWGEYYRLPTFLELFGNVGSITGSADLESEEGLNRDVGIVFAVDRLGTLRRPFFEAVYVNNKVENLILYFLNSQYTSRPKNIGSAVIRGWELSFSGFLSDRFRLGGNYSHIVTEDTSDIPYYRGNQLPSMPKDEGALSIDWVEKRWKIGYEIHYIGSNYLDRANFGEVPSRHIHNLSFTLYPPVEGLSFTLEGRNLTDDQISDISGFPLPGRTTYATLSYHH